MKYQVRYGGRTFDVGIEGEPPHYVLHLDGRRTVVDAATLGEPALLSLLLENVACLAHVVPAPGATSLFEVSIGGKLARLQVQDELAAMAQQMHAPQSRGPVQIHSPMPGMVVAVRVAAGDRVEPGTALVVIEAMKMQNELASEVSGTVRTVHVQVNEPVDTGADLLVIETDSS